MINVVLVDKLRMHLLWQLNSDKLKNDLPLNSPDYDTFFTSGEKGYLDYSVAMK